MPKGSRFQPSKRIRDVRVWRASALVRDVQSFESLDSLTSTDGDYCWEDWYCKDLRRDPTAREAVIEVIIETLQEELGKVNGLLLGLLRAGYDTGYMARQAQRKLCVKLTPLETWVRVESEVKPALVSRLLEAGFSLRGYNQLHPLTKKIIGLQSKYARVVDRKLSNGKHKARKEGPCISTTFLSEYRRASKSPAATSP